MNWYEDWTGESEALTKFGTGNVSAASTAAAIVAKAKAEAEAKAGETDERTWRDDPKFKKVLEEASKAKQAPAAPSAPAAPKPASYAAPAAAPAAPAADAPKPAEEPWWSSTAAKATAIGLGAGAITLALLRRK